MSASGDEGNGNQGPRTDGPPHVTQRPAPLSAAPDTTGWLARRKGGGAASLGSELTELVLVDLATCRDLLFEIERETPRLSDEDETRINRLADPEARADRRAAHIALRVMLERFAGPCVRTRPYRLSAHGKPHLVFEESEASMGAQSRLPPQFSLSHTQRLALIGVSTSGPIGIDLERHRTPRIMGERRRAIEQAAIELARGAPLPDHNSDARFLTAWVRLEAIAKADGAGVGAHLSIILGRRGSATGSGASGSAATLTAHDLPSPSGFYAALAWSSGVKVPECLAFPADRAGLGVFLEENASEGGTRR